MGCSSILACAATLAPAHADAPADSGILEDVIVTAQKRSQSIGDVGLTIQAATSDTLYERGIGSPSDLSKLVPGFSYTESIYSTPVFTLRGIGLYDATFGAPPAVSVYTDQVPRNFPVMSQALDLDLERIEVLKGPQGTLFGQSSTGGAINYITAKPTDAFKTGVDLSYARFGRFEASAFVSGPVSDTLKARLAVKVAEGGDWQRSISRPNDEYGAARKLSGRLSVQWTPTDQLDVLATFTGVRDRSDVQAPQYVGSVFNVYSAAALAVANSSPATANPFGVVNDALYAGLTNPASLNFDATFLGRQATLVGRMNGANPALAAGARAILGTPTTNAPRLAEWTPGFLGKSDNEYYQGTLRADYAIVDGVTLTWISALAKQDLDYAQDLDGTTAVAVDVPLFGDVKTFNQELRIAGETGSFNWIVGGSYDHLRTSQNNYYQLADYSGNDPLGGAFPDLYDGVGFIEPISYTFNEFESKLKTYAGFANLDYRATGNLTLSAGVRYTKNKQDASYCYNDPAIDATQGTAKTFWVFESLFTGAPFNTPFIQPGECFVLGDGAPGTGTSFGVATRSPAERKLSEDNWSFRFGANYKFDAGTLLYATVSRGYKTGMYSAIGASSTSQYSPAVQEKVIAYEAGFKAPLAGQRVNLNGAVFYYDYSDKQVRGRVLDAVYGLLEKMVNVPKSRIWGVEAELTARPVDGFTLSAGATWLDSKVSRSFTATADGSSVYNAQGYRGDFKGSELPFTPKFTWNLDAQYEWAVGDGYLAFLGGTIVRQDDQNTTFKNDFLLAQDFEIEGYTTVDLRAGVASQSGRWRATAFGRNVFNKKYTTSITTYLDTLFRFMGRPATYGVSAQFRF